MWLILPLKIVVLRLHVAGEAGRLFAGVIAHINGFTKLPVETIRELLVSRGGVIEAYNTSKCTHMICESLPYAKVRELRKVSRLVSPRTSPRCRTLAKAKARTNLWNHLALLERHTGPITR